MHCAGLHGLPAIRLVHSQVLLPRLGCSNWPCNCPGLLPAYLLACSTCFLHSLQHCNCFLFCDPDTLLMLHLLEPAGSAAVPRGSHHQPRLATGGAACWGADDGAGGGTRVSSDSPGSLQKEPWRGTKLPWPSLLGECTISIWPQASRSAPCSHMGLVQDTHRIVVSIVGVAYSGRLHVMLV